MNHTTGKILLSMLLVGLAPVAVSANKTDIVYLDNGDRLTGDFRSMERGQIDFNTDVADTISLEWDMISQVVIQREILVQTVTGTRFSGHIEKTDNPYEITVATGGGPVTLKNIDVVKMNSLDERGWRDLEVDVSVGYSFAKASSVAQFSGSASITKRTEKYIANARGSTDFSSSSNNPSSQRADLAFIYSRLRPNRWLTSGLLSFDKNDELNIDLRTSVGGGIGRILKQSNHSYLMLQGGLLLSREDLIGATDDNDSVESFAEIQWDWFKFTKPDLNWSSSLAIIPSLTDKGRVRGQFTTSLSWTIVGNLSWQIQFYDSYDSKPQTVNTPTNDYGINTSLAQKF
jgi:hypothetical protein